MEKLLKTGKVKAIGVSNFGKGQLERLVQNTSVVPAVHQLESHPWLQQKEFMKWHESKGIHITHYSPFGNLNEIYAARHLGRLIDEPVLAEVGKKYAKSGSQVCIGESVRIDATPSLRRSRIGEKQYQRRRNTDQDYPSVAKHGPLRWATPRCPSQKHRTGSSRIVKVISS